MKFSALAVLLVIAGAYAAPEVDFSVSSGRIYDLLVKDALERIIAYLERIDPLVINDRDFDIVIVARQAEAKGNIKRLVISGGSDIRINRLYYNILWGILDFDVSIPRVRVELGGADVDVIYGDRKGSGTARGSLEVTGIVISGTVYLEHDYNGQAQIVNINPDLKVASISADWTIVGSQDYSAIINNLFNVRIPEYFVLYKHEINYLLGRGLIYGAGWWKDRN